MQIFRPLTMLFLTRISDGHTIAKEKRVFRRENSKATSMALIPLISSVLVMLVVKSETRTCRPQFP